MEEVVELDGNTGFRLEGRAQFPGLDIEYCPPGWSTLEREEGMLRSRLASLEYIKPVFNNDGEIFDDAHYTWFADRAEWPYSFGLNHENAFQPLVRPTWLGDVCAKISSSVDLNALPTHRAALVTWCPDSGKVPRPRIGSQTPSWRSTSTYYVYFGTVPQSLGIVASAKNPHQSESKRIRLTMREGSLLVVRGVESHTLWDIFFCPTPGDPVVADTYWVIFQSIIPLYAITAMAESKRTPFGVAKEERVVPAFRSADQNKDDLDIVISLSTVSSSSSAKQSLTTTTKRPVKRRK